MSQELLKKAVQNQRESVIKALEQRAAGAAEAGKADEKGAVEATITSLRKDVPDFRIGDTVNVSVRIVEGDKERVQVFGGVVISRRGSGISEYFTVRRIVNNEGVERVFPLNSPKVAKIEVVRGGKVRRAKLYFLRDRVGKATRLKEVKSKRGKAQSKALMA